MRKKGAVLILDLEALKRAKGVLQKSVKSKQKSMRMVVDCGKVAGIATIPKEYARRVNSVVALMIGLLENVSGIAA